MPIRVCVVSDHHIFRWGLEQLLADETSNFDVICTGESYSEAVAGIGQKKPDIILIDSDENQRGVLEAIPKLLEASPDTKIVLFARNANDTALDAAIVAGARGILKHDTTPEMLVAALARVDEGEMWLDRETTGRVFVELSRRATMKAIDILKNQQTALTKREYAIIACLADHCGETGKSIAKRLHISESTLRNHLTSIYDKTGVSNRSALISFAIKNGLSSAN